MTSLVALTRSGLPRLFSRAKDHFSLPTFIENVDERVEETECLLKLREGAANNP